MKTITGIILLLLLAGSGSARAAVINAASPSLADVNSAVSSASDGDTVVIPTGSATWSSQLSITKAITLGGSGPDARPNITSTSTGAVGIIFTVPTGKTVIFQHMNFAEFKATNALIEVAGEGLDVFRLTDLVFTHENAVAAIWISSASSGRTAAGPYGLIDHCNIIGSGYGIFIRDNDSLSSWARPMTFGSSNAVYVEDCTFGNTTFTSGRPVLDSNNGSRWVFRHNTIVNQNVGTHGADSSGPVNSSLQFELMHNTFKLTNNPPGVTSDAFVSTRGGTGVMFDNTGTADAGTWVNHLFKVAYYRASSNGGVTVDRFYPGDYVGTQQPGCGYVATPGQDPNYPTKTWGTVPMYFWGNSVSGPGIEVLGVGIGGTPYSDYLFMQAGRDYYNNGTQMPGYTEYIYPHPLQGSGLAPEAPHNLEILP